MSDRSYLVVGVAEAIAGFDDRPDASAESGNVVVTETEFAMADNWADILEGQQR